MHTCNSQAPELLMSDCSCLQLCHCFVTQVATWVIPGGIQSIWPNAHCQAHILLTDETPCSLTTLAAQQSTDIALFLVLESGSAKFCCLPHNMGVYRAVSLSLSKATLLAVMSWRHWRYWSRAMLFAMQDAADAPGQRQGDVLELTCNGMVSHSSFVQCTMFQCWLQHMHADSVVSPPVRVLANAPHYFMMLVHQ